MLCLIVHVGEKHWQLKYLYIHRFCMWWSKWSIFKSECDLVLSFKLIMICTFWLYLKSTSGLCVNDANLPVRASVCQTVNICTIYRIDCDKDFGLLTYNSFQTMLLWSWAFPHFLYGSYLSDILAILPFSCLTIFQTNLNFINTVIKLPALFQNCKDKYSQIRYMYFFSFSMSIFFMTSILF